MASRVQKQLRGGRASYLVVVLVLVLVLADAFVREQ
jgi:hypothetical protein